MCVFIDLLKKFCVWVCVFYVNVIYDKCFLHGIYISVCIWLFLLFLLGMFTMFFSRLHRYECVLFYLKFSFWQCSFFLLIYYYLPSNKTLYIVNIYIRGLWSRRSMYFVYNGIDSPLSLSLSSVSEVVGWES